MAGTLRNVINISKTVNNVTKLFKNSVFSMNNNLRSILTCRAILYPNQFSLLHTSAKQCGLMEFFDDEKNWGVQKIKCGRAWTKDELRLKSNEDLHKLWYVLLKERNMLKTMEHACNEECRIFPNPERIDKVEDSMENLENVVRERNQAYNLLETGETGERPTKYVNSALGLKFFYRMRQYLVPKFINTKWKKTHFFGYDGYAVRNFLRLYREKLWNEKRRQHNRDTNHVIRLIKTFPNLDEEAVKAKFPKVNLKKIKTLHKARGHYLPK